MKLKTSLTRFRKPSTNDHGGSLVETALLLGTLGPVLLLGTTESAFLAYQAIELSNAAAAGASYAVQFYMANSNTALPTQSQVAAAVQNDAPELQRMLKSGTQISVTMATGCTGNAPTAGNSIPSCLAGVQPYVQITTQATLRSIVNAPGLPSSLTLTRSATMVMVN